MITTLLFGALACAAHAAPSLESQAAEAGARFDLSLSRDAAAPSWVKGVEKPSVAASMNAFREKKTSAEPPAPSCEEDPNCGTAEEWKFWHEMRNTAVGGAAASAALGIGLGAAGGAILLGAAIGLGVGAAILYGIGRVLAQGVRSPAFQRWFAIHNS
ncbi:MAG: hypothetical protein HY925_04595 [Elusimicrobia bacterium]|nr:hypothetical protein [Elusimicrobiota bacterium]